MEIALPLRGSWSLSQCVCKASISSNGEDSDGGLVRPQGIFFMFFSREMSQVWEMSCAQESSLFVASINVRVPRLGDFVKA